MSDCQRAITLKEWPFYTDQEAGMPTISCPDCGAKHSISDEKLASVDTMTCQRCQRMFEVKAPAPALVAPGPPRQTPFVFPPAPGQPEKVKHWTEAGWHWLACGVVDILAFLAWTASITQGASAIQQASVSAMASFVVIAAYVMARTLDAGK